MESAIFWNWRIEVSFYNVSDLLGTPYLFQILNTSPKSSKNVVKMNVSKGLWGKEH